MSNLREQVFAYLRQIPHGKVVTYGQIGAHLGNRHLARAVGNLLHTNPDPFYYPCYKVVLAAGALTRNYPFGGINAQKRLLEAEGIVVSNGCVDLTACQWQENQP